MMLRPAVNEQDWGRIERSKISYMQFQASAAFYCVCAHVDSPEAQRSLLQHDVHLKLPEALSRNVRIGWKADM
jgi:hypothetical protein